MPRGSDAEAAGAELQARTGFAPNAEEMIAENTARFSEEMRAASNRPIDQEATDEMDDDEAQGYLDDADDDDDADWTVVAYAVRGPFVVIAAENDDTGEVKKTVHVVKGQEKKAERLANRGQAKKADDGDDEDAADKPTATPRRSTAASSGSSASK